MKKAGSFVILLACSLSACVAPALDEETFDESSVVDEVEQELGEPGCGTVALDASIGINQTSTSPTTTYGSTTCPGQYVVGLTAKGDVRRAEWIDSPGEADCEAYHVEEGHYRSTCYFVIGGGMHCTNTLLGVMKYHGEYYPDIPGEDTVVGCFQVPDTGYYQPAWPAVGLLNYYRIAARAYKVQNGIEVPKKVAVTISKIY